MDRGLELRMVTEDDRHKVFSTVDENRVHLRKWLPWIDASQSPRDYIQVIKIWRQEIEETVSMQLGIFYHGEFIGMCGFNSIDHNSKRVQMGYWVSAEYEGRGLIRQCVSALIEYGFNQMRLNRIEIICGKKNLRSRKLPEALGFTEEAVLKEYEYLYNHYHDCVMYRLLRRER